MNNNLIVKSLLVLGLSVTSIMANEVNNQANKASVAKIVIPQNMDKKNTLVVLDKVLSPFEDMTEYALAKDISGMKKSYKNIKNNEHNALLEQTISSVELKNLSKNIEKLGTYINNNDFAHVALLSANMFNSSVINFKYKNNIQDQLHIEHLDYMGFRLLALLNTQNIDYTQMSKVITNSKINLDAIKNKVKDKNSVDAFNLLFQGLEESVKTKNNVMIKILAELDLALVDIIEKQM